MQLAEDFDVITAATDVVEGKLGLLEALCEANKFRMEEGSRTICRCPACRGENAILLGWLWDIRHREPEDRQTELWRQVERARRN